MELLLLQGILRLIRLIFGQHQLWFRNVWRTRGDINFLNMNSEELTYNISCQQVCLSQHQTISDIPCISNLEKIFLFLLGQSTVAKPNFPLFMYACVKNIKYTKRIRSEYRRLSQDPIRKSKILSHVVERNVVV